MPPQRVPPEGQALGDGTADLASVIRALQEIGYSGWWNHEGPMEHDPEDSERRSLAFMKAVLAPGARRPEIRDHTARGQVGA